MSSMTSHPSPLSTGTSMVQVRVRVPGRVQVRYLGTFHFPPVVLYFVESP